MNVADSISVVIPAYNAAGTIGRAIRSVLDQTRPVDEIIVVDDGSVDGTAGLVERQFPQVKLIRQANAGPSAARNTGIAAAGGEYIAFLDADDYWLPEKIERQVRLMTEHPDTALVACGQWRIAGGDEKARPHAADTGTAFYMVTFRDLLRNNLVGTSSVLAKAEALKSAGCFDISLKYGEDLDLWLKITYDRPVAILHDTLIVYHETPQGLSRDLARMIDGELAVLARWDPSAPGGLDIKRTITAKYYRESRQWWRLKHALRCFAADQPALGKAQLRTLMRPGHVRLPYRVLAILGLFSPGLYTVIGTLKKRQIYRRVL